MKGDARIHIEGRGLILAGGNAIGTNGGQSVVATLICGTTVHSTPVANAIRWRLTAIFRIDDVLSSAPSHLWDNPVLLIRSSKIPGNP